MLSMQLSFTEKKSIRKNFGKLKEILSIPNLIEVQKKSYNQFLSTSDVDRQSMSLQKGLHKVFLNILQIPRIFGVGRGFNIVIFRDPFLDRFPLRNRQNGTKIFRAPSAREGGF